MGSGIHRLEWGILTCLLLAAGTVAAMGTMLSAPDASQAPSVRARVPPSPDTPPTPTTWTVALRTAATSPSLIVRGVTWAGLSVPLTLPLAFGLVLRERRQRRVHERAVDGLLQTRMPPRTPLPVAPRGRDDRLRAPRRTRAATVVRAQGPATRSAPDGSVAARSRVGSWLHTIRGGGRASATVPSEDSGHAHNQRTAGADAAAAAHAVEHAGNEHAPPASHATPPRRRAHIGDEAGERPATRAASRPSDPSIEAAESFTATLEQVVAAQDDADDGSAEAVSPPAAQALDDEHVLATVSVVMAAVRQAQCPITVLAADAHADRTDVVLQIDGDEDAAIDRLVRQLRHDAPALLVRWSRPALSIAAEPRVAVSHSPIPILLPMLTRSKQHDVTRYIALEHWHHLGIYGADAIHMCHHVLTTVCAQQRPDDIALAFVDRDDVLAPLYRRAPHGIDLPHQDGCAALDGLGAAIKPRLHAPLRPLVVVVVRPDDAMLQALDAVVTRVRHLTGVPLHFVVVQEALQHAGRGVYAALPALIGSGGHGEATWLPGITAWPKNGQAVLVMGTARSVGHALTADDIDAVQLLDTMRGVPISTVPTLLTAPDTLSVPCGDTPDDGASAVAPTAPHTPPSALLQTPDVHDGASSRHVRAVVPRWSLDVSTPSTPCDDAGPAAVQSASHGVPVDAAITHAELVPVEHDVDLPKSALDALEQAMQRPAALDAAAGQQGASDGDGADAGDGEDRMHISSAAPRATASRTMEPDTAPPAVDDDTSIAWPAGPPPLTGDDLGQLLYLMVTTPHVVDGKGAGLTKNRIKAFLQAYRGNDVLAKQLMVWFDHAGVLEPMRSDLRWREPRALYSTDLRRIAHALHAHPCVDAATAQATFDESLR